MQKDAGVIARFGSRDIELMQQKKMILLKDGESHLNPEYDYLQNRSQHETESNVLDAIREPESCCNLLPYVNHNGLFTGIVAFTRQELFA